MSPLQVWETPCLVTEMSAHHISETWGACSTNAIFSKTELNVSFPNQGELSHCFRSSKLDVSLKSFDAFYTEG